MKLHNDTAPALIVGGQEKASFTIKANGHTFKHLMSTLYSNKQKAVLREITANALDANVASGTDKPVEIKFPGVFDDDLMISDYGPGMTHDFVMRLFSQLFHSEKQDSNDFTGAFGLGSKSPLCITQTYNIHVREKHQKRMYVIAMDEAGIPSITHFGNFPGEFDTGVDVILPKAGSKNWSQTYQDMQYDFAGENIATSGPVITFEDAISVFKGETCTVKTYRSHGRYGSPTFYVKQGAVAYPVELKELTAANFGYGGVGNDPIRLLSDLKSVVVIEVPIGSLSVALNRETLEKDERTVAKLIEIGDDVIDAISEGIRETVENISSFESWQLAIFNHIYQKEKPIVRCPLNAAVFHRVDDIAERLSGLKKPATKLLTLSLADETHNGVTLSTDKVIRNTYRVNLSQGYNISERKGDDRPTINVSRTTSYGAHVTLEKNTIVIVGNLGSRMRNGCFTTKFRDYLYGDADPNGPHDTWGTTIYHVRCAQARMREVVKHVQDAAGKENVFLFKDVTHVEPRKITTLAPRTKKSNKGEKGAGKLTVELAYKQESDENKRSVELGEVYYYVRSYGNKPTWDFFGVQRYAYNLYSEVKGIIDVFHLGIDPKKVVRITASQEGKVIENEKCVWLDFNDLVLDTLHKRGLNKHIALCAAIYEDTNSYGDRTFVNTLSGIRYAKFADAFDKYKAYPKYHPLYAIWKYVSVIDSVTKTCRKYKATHSLSESLIASATSAYRRKGLPADLQKAREDIKAYRNAIEKELPLLHHLTCPGGTANEEIINGAVSYAATSGVAIPCIKWSPHLRTKY